MYIVNMLFILFAFAFLPTAFAHSWVECTNYHPPSFDYQSLGYFDRARCDGYPRAFARQFAAGFGQDTGYNYEMPTCRESSFVESDYSTDIPMATYTPGSVIYTSHPAKNHVADVCENGNYNNPNIPSASMVLKMSSLPEIDSFDITIQPIGGEHVFGKVDHLGYQRCYRFCEDTDKSHCILGWRLPENIQPGRHSFHWLWEFNSGQFYSNCFDAYISGSSNGSFANDTTSNLTITFPPTTVPATITFPPIATTSLPVSTPTDSVSGSMTPTPEVISGSSSLSSPLGHVATYLLNITGMLNVSIWQS